jgi:hypothetical protein
MVHGLGRFSSRKIPFRYRSVKPSVGCVDMTSTTVIDYSQDVQTIHVEVGRSSKEGTREWSHLFASAETRAPPLQALIATSEPLLGSRS